MKIICIVGKSDAPEFYLKPDSALNLKRLPYFLPEVTGGMQVREVLAVRIDKVGKCIQEKFAHKYYNEVAAGVDFVAGQMVRENIEEGQPWGRAISFDGSLTLGDFVPLGELGCKPEEEAGTLVINGEKTASATMVQNVDRTISDISQYMTLKTGDLLVFEICRSEREAAIGDIVEASIQGGAPLKVAIK